MGESAARQTRSRKRKRMPLALSVEEAALALSISRDSFERHVAPHLRLLPVGRRLVVPVQELERWIERRSAPAPAEHLNRLRAMR